MSDLPAPSSTRDRLVAAARRLFWEQGYHATGIAQILREADARSGSLYYFFPTKEDLLLAVLEEYRTLLWPEVLEPAFDRVADPVERVFAILDGYRRLLLLTEFHSGCPIGNLALEVGADIAAARALLAANFAAWRDAVRACLEEAADRFPRDADLDQLATFVLTTMEGGVMLARTERSLEPFERAVAALRDYVERLLEDGGTWDVRFHDDGREDDHDGAPRVQHEYD